MTPFSNSFCVLKVCCAVFFVALVSISHFQIFDANGWTTTLLTELYVPIPEASMVAGTVDIEPFEFSSDHFMTYKHDGVGSGKYVLQP